jgi:type I restriction enzyme S subunit
MNQKETIGCGIKSVPKGYKKTDLGLLPNEWDVSPISKNMKLINGFGFKPHQWSLYGLPIIRIQNLNSEKAKFNYFEGKVDDKFHVKKGDLLFAWSGSKGSSFGARVWIGPPAILNQHIFRVVPNKNVITPKFSFYILRQVQEQIEKMAHGFKSSFVHVKKNDLSSTLLPVPSIKEQTAITNVLSDVDALLSELEKLIVKKQAIKTATMQQLLSGKTRLPAFATYDVGTHEGKRKYQTKGTKPSELGEIPEDWNATFASEIISFIGGFGFSSRLATSSGIKWLKIANVGLNEIKWDADSYLPESLSSSFKDYLLKVNDVVMALTRPLLKDKLKVARLKINDLPALLNQRVAKLVPKGKNNLDYIYYVVQRAEFIAAMNLAMAGSDPPNIGTTALGNINILIPSSPEEQTAIATILSDMDEEIQALEQRLTKTRQIKQGMMQELLTGKTRLPFDKN